MDASRWVLLLRGINVGRASRVGMADLRELVTDLGFSDVVTVLQSGNVILSGSSRPVPAEVEAAITSRTGVSSRVVVLSLAEFEDIADANPLLEVSDDLSKMVVTFLDGDIVPDEVERPTEAELAPEILVATSRAIYSWYPDGILQSKLSPKFWKQFGPVVTSRNVRTVDRIRAASRN